ncbi:MAG: hypothetical protein ACFE95_04310, partial [Candidatus Hodarchaeota archaeon]
TASKGDEIMAVFYGSGAGSDVISIKLKANGTEIANNDVPTVQEQIDYKQKISVDEYIRFRDSPDQAAKHIALLEVEPISEDFYEVEGCPDCGAVYFRDSWTKTNFPDFIPPEKFGNLKDHCLRGIQKKSADAKRICGTKLEKVKIHQRARIKQVEFHGPKKSKKQIGHPEDPYWTMFDHKMVRGFNYNPKICNFTEGEEVKAVIGRWRPAPKGWVPLLYVPMYTHLRSDFSLSS